MTTDIRINRTTSTIELTKKFSAAASRFGTDEYRMLQEARRDYPNYRIVERKVSSSSSRSSKGLTYDKMERYINAQLELANKDDNNEKISHLTEAKNTLHDFRNDEFNSMSYGEVKKWFFEEFPELKNKRAAGNADMKESA